MIAAAAVIYGAGISLFLDPNQLAPGGVTPYNNLPMECREVVWQDLNGDGQTEAVLTVAAAAADDYEDTKRIIFALDADGTVYAYCMNYMWDCSLEGTVFVPAYRNGEAYSVDFQGPQFYCYGVNG